jgi:hypothetical protein
MVDAFDYVHVSGCSCSGPDYSERRAFALMWLLELHEQLPAQLVPDGSCLAWLGLPRAWPSRHRDYHLLARYDRAIQHGKYEVADRSPHDSAESCAARAALREALAAAPWGPQPDGSFVARRSIGVASGRYVHTLLARERGRPLAVINDHAHGDGSYIVTIRVRSQALVRS